MNEASARTINPKTMRGPFCEWAEVPDTAYDDGKLALKAIADLKRLKEQGKPFFMECGFQNPHAIKKGFPCSFKRFRSAMAFNASFPSS